MGLTSALNTSLNGLTLNETTIDVLGNNIANAGTNGFKASQVLFTTQLSRTLSIGSRPTVDNGGTNPRQIGLGSTTAAIRKDFTQGSITSSSSPSDLAIQGDGFFIVNGSEGNVYTRSGNFSRNSASKLVNDQGLLVQGYGIDDNFNLITTQITDITIPLGNLNVAQQTSNITMSGALYSTGDLATQGSLLTTTDAYTDAGNAGNPITAATLLVDLRDPGNTQLFNTGDELKFTGKKGERILPSNTLNITATTTVGEWLTFLDHSLGIHSGGTIPNDPTHGAQPGITVTAGGEIQIIGNLGTVHDLSVSAGDMTINNVVVPMGFNKSASATGESTITDFIVYDSLGQEVTVKMTAVLEDRTGGSTTFRYYIDSFDDSDLDTMVQNGILTFDSNGNIASGQSATFSIDRANSAAVSPMQVTVDFSNLSGISSVSAGSTLSLALQNGSSPGTLVNFVIDEKGVVNGIFDNGIIRTLGQVVLARFANTQGLVEVGGGTYREGVSSGSPFITAPGNFGAGSLRAGSIELSNTDIGRSLVDLIVASTNYRGNARVISSVQQLVDELLVLGR